MRKITACVKFGPSQHYQRQAFEAGLASIGFEIVSRPLVDPHPGDLLVLWNRYSRDEGEARRYEAHGSTVLVAENAWIGPEEKDSHHFAICRGHHNGAGSWHVGPTIRYPVAELKPWRATGYHILIMPSRGMGEPGVCQPGGMPGVDQWVQDTWNRISMETSRPIKIRKHPGIRPHPVDIPELDDCWAVVTWGSGAAIKAIIAGIPVFYEYPQWIGGVAAKFGFTGLEHPYTGERETLLRYLSWAQWKKDEIERGEPFRWLASPSSSPASSGPEKRSALT